MVTSWQWSFVGRHGVEPVERIAERWAGGKSIVFTSREVTHLTPRFSTPPYSLLSYGDVTMSNRVSPGAVGLVLASCASLQLGGAVATHVFPHAGPWGVTTIRLLVAGLLLFAIARPAVRDWTRTQWVAVGLFAVTLAGMNGFYYAAIALIPLAPAVTIEFIGPLLLAALLSRGAREFLWVGLAAGGLALLGWDSWTGESLDPWGVTWALVAGAFWMGYILASRRVGELVPGQGGLAVAFLLAAAMVVPFGAGGVATILDSPGLLGLAVLTAVLASLIPYSFELVALRSLPPAVFGVLLALEPVFAALIGWVVLGQTASVALLVAVAMVVAASMGTTLTARR